MAMYYPQDTTRDMGPTGVASNTAYVGRCLTGDRKQNKLPSTWRSKELMMECKAGTVVIIHYDIWHKGSANLTEKNRYMFKFQFLRMEDPVAPTWETTAYSSNSLTTPFDKINDPYTPLWSFIWTWLCGGQSLVTEKLKKKPNQEKKKMDSKNSTIEKLLTILDNTSDDEDPARLNAVYSIATEYGSEEAALFLSKKLSHCGEKDEQIIRNAAYGLSAMGAFSVKFLQEIMVKSPCADVRAVAVAALGEIASLSYSTVPQIVSSLLKDPSVDVRRNAAEALGIICSAAVSNNNNNNKNNTSAVPVNSSATNSNNNNVSEGKIESINEENYAILASEQLCECVLRDKDAQTRFQATLAVAQLAKNLGSEKMVDALELMLLDEDRYVRGYAVEALKRIQNPKATQVLLKHLETSRWCALTTVNTQF
jgi:HEAT repeat protein